jgi:hypothetical protein
MNILSQMTISVFDIQSLSLASHAYLNQVVTYLFQAILFVLYSSDSCLLVNGILLNFLFLIDIYSRARFIGLITRNALSHRVRHILRYYLFYVCASSFVTSSVFYFSSASLAYFWNT